MPHVSARSRPLWSRILPGALTGLLAMALPALAAPDQAQQSALDRLVRDLVPVVERVAGATFDDIPEVVIADADVLSRVVYEEQVYLLSHLTEQTEAQSNDSARSTANDVAHLFAGKYGFLDKRLYISLDSIVTALAERGGDPRLAMPVVKVVLAHELTHALQDQKIDLDQLVTRTHTADAIMAANCLVEGHAVWVHETVGEELGQHDGLDVMSDLLGYRVRGMPSDPSAFQTAYVYGMGRDFVSWQAEQRGAEGLWEVLDTPPATTAMIVHPETYGAEPPATDSSLRRALHRARRRLGARQWSGDIEPIGDFDLREQLVLSGQVASADRVESAWRMRANDHPMHGIEVQVLRFADPRMASRYVRAMGRQAAYQAATVSSDPHVSAWTGAFDALPTDRSARELVVLELPGTREELGTLWLAQGPDVVQVISVNVSRSDRHLARALRPLLRSLRRTALPAPSTALAATLR